MKAEIKIMWVSWIIRRKNCIGLTLFKKRFSTWLTTITILIISLILIGFVKSCTVIVIPTFHPFISQ